MHPKWLYQLTLLISRRLSKIFWLLSALAWGVIRLVVTRAQANIPDESVWGFGQVLAVLLLVLPFFSLGEQLITDVATDEGDEDASNTAFCHENTERAEFLQGILKLEERAWYQTLGILVFEIAVIIAADLLYTFPYQSFLIFGPGGSIFPYGIRSMAYFPGFISKVYIIWHTIIGCMLFLYTIICLTLAPQIGPSLCRLVFGNKPRARNIIFKVSGFISMFILLSATKVCVFRFLH